MKLFKPNFMSWKHNCPPSHEGEKGFKEGGRFGDLHHPPGPPLLYPLVEPFLYFTLAKTHEPPKLVVRDHAFVDPAVDSHRPDIQEF